MMGYFMDRDGGLSNFIPSPPDWKGGWPCLEVVAQVVPCSHTLRDLKTLLGHYYTYLVVQWSPTGAAAQVQGLTGAGGYGGWNGGQGLGFRAEFWVLGRKPLVATCKGEYGSG